MIAVVGEALVDLIVDPNDPRHPVAHPGGSPANVAVALARLGTPVCFVGRSGTDAFGDLMRSHLAGNGVDLSHVVAASEPSSVAMVSLGADGTASYNFHVAGTADWSWADGELPATLPAETAAIHTGSLALATAPGGVVIEDWLARLRARHTISVDPNVRPALVGPRQDYQRRLAHWLHLADWRTPSGRPSAPDLIEVQMLAGRGWAVAPREPWLAFLPAVWPAQCRGWIRNRVPWVWRCAGQPPTLAPPTETDLISEGEAQEDYPADLEGTGIPVPPLGRIWLLRSPVDGVTVTEIAQAIQGVAVRWAGGEDIFLNKHHLVDAARDVLSWDSATINRWLETTRRA